MTIPYHEGGSVNRRQLLSEIGILSASTLAGCAEILEGGTAGDGSDSHGGTNGTGNDGTGDGTGTTEPNPTYTPVVEVPDGIDYTDSSEAEIPLYVERTLDGETTILDPENVEITNAETVRDHPEYDREEPRYDTETMQQAGLYNQIINETEHPDGETWTINSNDLIAGNNILTLEFQFEDEEHDENGEENIEQEITVLKTPEETLTDTHIENQELYDQLREQQITRDLQGSDFISRDSQYNNWMEVIEHAYETAHEEWDMESLNREEKIHRYALHWIQNAKDAIGAQPSGQANFLADGLEYILEEDVTAGQMNNAFHNTVIMQDWDVLQQTGHVETNRGGLTAFPAKEAGFPEANRGDTPLWTTRNNLGQAEGLLEEMVRLRDRFDEQDEIPYTFAHNIDMSDEEFLVESMAEVREGVAGPMIRELQDVALTSELSPEVDYTVEGTPDNMEINATL